MLAPVTATVVLAPDSFKGSLAAADACRALATGWHDVDPSARIVSRPMADGGEGTLAAIEAAVPAAQRMPVTVTGPDGTATPAHWLLLPNPQGDVGIVELASTSGIELLGDTLRPWDADTVGFGQAIAAALDHGVTRLIVGIGSSASTDGGAGMLSALGAVALDADGTPLAPTLRTLADVARVDVGALRPLPRDGVVVLTDVTNPLLGAVGAAAVFGPQKGVPVADVPRADAALAHWADALGAALPVARADAAGAGAAGGTGFALQAWGAASVSGAAEVARLVRLADAVAVADAVITGEGSYDGQSAAGKAPAHVARLAAAAGVPVLLVAGRISAATDGFADAVSLTDLAGTGSAARAEPVRWLRRAGADLARRHGMPRERRPSSS